MLEWVGAFSEETDAQIVQRNFLKKVKSDLNEQGHCVIGIENRFGLKYLMGAVDDHIGAPGIAIFDAELAKKKWRELTGKMLRVFTYTLEEYRQLFKEVGFKTIKIYAAFPDYKIPQVILSADEKNEVNKYFNENNYIEEHNGVNGNLLENQTELQSHYLSMSKLGIAQYFAPSYIISAE